MYFHALCIFKKSRLRELDSRGECRHLNTTLGTQIKNSDPQKFLKFPQEKSPRRPSSARGMNRSAWVLKVLGNLVPIPHLNPLTFPDKALCHLPYLQELMFPRGCLTLDKSRPGGEAFHSFIPVLLIPVIRSIISVSLGCRIKSPLNFCSPCEHLNHQTASSCPVL